MINTKTVSFNPSTASLDTFDGWFVNCRKNDEVRVEGLGSLKSTHVKRATNGCDYLQEIAISKKLVRIHVPVSSEDNPFNHEKTELTYALHLRSNADKKVYYRIFMDNIVSLSKDFEIILETSIKELYGDHYQKVVYAALPADLPLIVDSKGVLCVSPT